jgi:Transglutaminase-like superfamily
MWGLHGFSGRSNELRFDSTVLEHLPLGATGHEIEDTVFPVEYSADEMPDLANSIERQHPDPGKEVSRWALQFVPSNGSIGAFALLTRLSQGIKGGFLYRRREAKGIQPPAETLRLGHGSCRDFAILMIEAARSLGYAARFASGYLAVPFDDPTKAAGGSDRGSTHAWAQIYLPGMGWIDFDPTSGSVGNVGLVSVAVVRDPYHAIPLHGTFIGFPSDHRGMEVQVSVTSGPPEAIWVAPQAPRGPVSASRGWAPDNANYDHIAFVRLSCRAVTSSSARVWVRARRPARSEGFSHCGCCVLAVSTHAKFWVRSGLTACLRCAFDRLAGYKPAFPT